VNILGTLRLIEGARCAGTLRIVFAASGGTLYGEPDSSELPIKESCAHHPLSPYGVSKKAAVDYMEAFKSMYGLDYCALALANVYGPRQDPNGEAGVIAIFAERLLKNQQVVIYGDGEQTRDFVFVDDVVDAFVRAGEVGGGKVINIGTGREVSVNELASIMVRVTGTDTSPVYARERTGELRRNSLDPSLAGSVLGWSAWTTLEGGIYEVIEHFRKALP
jgi:UDP-glucose 4-epimerase